MTRDRAARQPDFGYETDDRPNRPTMVVFEARTPTAESWLADAAASCTTGVTGEGRGRALRVEPRECAAFFAEFEKRGLRVEGFAATPRR